MTTPCHFLRMRSYSASVALGSWAAAAVRSPCNCLKLGLIGGGTLAGAALLAFDQAAFLP